MCSHLYAVNEVKTRAASLRTQYGKLVKPKASGSGQKPLTPKQRWILAHLEFLKPHMMHRAIELTLRLDVEDSEDIDETEEGQMEDENVVLDMSTDNNEMSQMLSPPSTSAQSSRSSVSATVEGETSSTELASHHDETPKRPRFSKAKGKSSDANNVELAKLTLLKQVHNTLSSTTNDSEEVFGQQVANELRSIKDRVLQLRVRRNIMNILYDALEAEQAREHVTLSQYQPGGVPFMGSQSTQGRYDRYTAVPMQVPHPPYQSQPAQQTQSQSLQPQPMSFIRMINEDE